MFDYKSYLSAVESFSKKGYETVKIGETVLGAPIYAIRRGIAGKINCLIHATIHAREYITSALVVKMIETYTPKKCGIWYIPVVNIDGMRIARGEKILPPEKEKMFSEFGDLRLIKCNANGVDLNVNFDADFGKGAKNVRLPAAENYIGEYPFSEPETVALRDFTLAVKPVVTISYHIKGEEIYYGYGEYNDFFAQAQKVSEVCGYPLKIAKNSCGGYKDWYILNRMGLGLTVEAGDDSYPHPYPNSRFGSIWKKNRDVPRICDEIAGEIYDELYGRSDNRGEEGGE